MTLEKAKELPELAARTNTYSQSDGGRFGSTNFRSNGFGRFSNNGGDRFGNGARTGWRSGNEYSDGARTGWRSGNEKSQYQRNGRK